ncbi:eukaryotic glutathione synthase, ATP binding domain-containing protein [Ditylenchus destructor]|uniref:Glutathione synthetase n=1 Tax=Ditylenchus destructor TaxID=166010 RepID=A0AAD4QZH4_9BILA|nr:eukaryotic glutathione synthase, ATP binding domain-containing protein [Ditylenchus destructor]
MLDFDKYADELVGNQSLEQVVEDARDFAKSTGIILRTNEHESTLAPMTLFPSPFPRKPFEDAVAVQDAMLELYYRISWDREFLIEAHKDVIKTDQFTRHLVDILERVWKEGITQTKTLLIQRADYMCDVGNSAEGELKQVEVNNIAVGMGGLGTKVCRLHRRVIRSIGQNSLEKNIPESRPVDPIAQGLHHAWKEFGNPTGVILFVIDGQNWNQFDQRTIEYAIDDLSGGTAKMTRLTLTECSERLTLTSKTLLLDSEREVSVIYFRSGYSPNAYPTEAEWNIRLDMERSTAIKCPWIGLQLANTKKVQQILSLSGMLERFLPGSSEIVKVIRKSFMGMWGLEDAGNPQIKSRIADAIENPQNYVLKQQMEGGGGNFHGEAISEKLRTLTQEQLSAFVLMERIKPLVVQNILLRPRVKPLIARIVAELGTFGYCYGDGSEIKKVYSSGHILRSKEEHVKDGGIAVGLSVLDSALLVQ